jgi:hypothetical protein
MSSETISMTGSLPVMTGAGAGACGLACFDERRGERRWGAVRDTCGLPDKLWEKGEIVDEAPRLPAMQRETDEAWTNLDDSPPGS